MRIAAVAVYATVAVIVGLTLVSGPPIGVEFTRESDDLSGLGTGNVSVDRVEAPGTAELAARRRRQFVQQAVPGLAVVLQFG